MPALPQAEYNRLKALIVREVNRQLVAPQSLIRLRIYMYYNLARPEKDGGIELLWVKLAYAIKRAVREGILKESPRLPGGSWLYLPSQQRIALSSLNRKFELYRSWKDTMNDKAGKHGPTLVRDALKTAGFTVAEQPVHVQHEGEDLEIDVATFAPLPLSVEVKNKLSEVYHSPVVTRYGDDAEQLEKHSRISHACGMIPVLVASLVDPSFYSFQAGYRGLHYRMLFQFLPAEDTDFRENIRKGVPLR